MLINFEWNVRVDGGGDYEDVNTEGPYTHGISQLKRKWVKALCFVSSESLMGPP